MAAVHAMPSLEGLRTQMAAVQIKENWFAGTFASALTSYQELVNSSALARFIISESGSRALQSLRDIDPFDGSEFAEAVDVQTPALSEEEIVGFLSDGGEPSSLPNQAYSYLRVCLTYLHRMAKVILTVVAIWQAYDFLEEKLQGASSATEVREVIRELPSEQRNLLYSYRVVIRDRVILRDGPGTHYADVGRLQLGTPLEVLEVQERWVKVSVDLFGEDTEGWVYRSLTAPIAHKKSRSGAEEVQGEN
jgi:hypothetical protein